MYFNLSQYNIVIEENADDVYLYNSYSGAFAKLEKRVYNSIINQLISDDEPCEYFDQLLSQGFIKPKDLDEYNKIITNERLAVYDNSPDTISLVIAPTLACNLNCVYCFESNNKSNKFMDEQTINDIINYISNRISRRTKALHITWFGGEPLLAYEKILIFNSKLQILLAEKDVVYSASMITNGILLDCEKVRVLSRDCAIKKIQVTIDGTQESYCRLKKATTKQYNQVIDNIVSAVECLNVDIRFNCGKYNFDEILQTAKLLIFRCAGNKNLRFYLAKLVDYGCLCNGDFCTQSEFDLKNIEFSKYICGLRGEEFKPKIPRYRKSFCGLYKLKNLVIGPNGEFYKCEHHIGKETLVIGNVNQGLFYNNAMLNFINVAFPLKCRTCKLFPLCVGGCPSQRYDLENSETCNISMEYIKKLLKLYIV